MRVVKLTQAPAGFNGHVHTLDMPEQDAAYLRSLGLHPGACVRVCSCKGHCVVDLGGAASGCRLGLTRPLAEGVLVSAQLVGASD